MLPWFFHCPADDLRCDLYLLFFSPFGRRRSSRFCVFAVVGVVKQYIKHFSLPYLFFHHIFLKQIIKRSIWRCFHDDIWFSPIFRGSRISWTRMAHSTVWYRKYSIAMPETKWQRKGDRQYLVSFGWVRAMCVCVWVRVIVTLPCIDCCMGRNSPESSICHLMRRKQGGDERKEKTGEKSVLKPKRFCYQFSIYLGFGWLVSRFIIIVSHSLVSRTHTHTSRGIANAKTKTIYDHERPKHLFCDAIVVFHRLVCACSCWFVCKEHIKINKNRYEMERRT